MKKIIFLLFFVPFFAVAQDCTLKKSTDPFTHDTKISTGFFAIGSGIGHALLSIDADSKEINLLFSVNGSGNKCFDDASTATILFDGSKVKTNLRNSAPMNCDGTFNINFRNVTVTPSQLQKLATQKVTTIRLTNDKNIVEINLSDEQKQLLMDMAACLIKESKALIKQ